MSLLNTSFAALTSGEVRDSTAEEAAIYYLDGNPTNGRLNIDGHVKFGDNTFILVEGNAGHSYNRGIIEGVSLTYAAKPSGGLRCDFGTNGCAYKTTDLRFLFLGDGQIYHHLEDNNRNSEFKGFTDLIINQETDRSEAIIQFNNKEYPNIGLKIADGAKGIIKIFVARSATSNGFTHLTGFNTEGTISELGIICGDHNTSSGHIVDPNYKGVTNNLMPLRITDNNGPNRRMYESFSLDLTAIRHDDARIRVVDSGGAVLHNDIALTDANTTPMANDGVTPLSFFAGKSVVLCRVREIGDLQSNSRNTISYTIRRAGYNEIVVSDLAMNYPDTIRDMSVDARYDSSIDSSTLTGINITGTVITVSQDITLQDLYNYSQWWLSQNGNLSISNFISISGNMLSITGYSLVVNTGATVSSTNSLNVLLAASITNNGTLNVNYVKSNGKVDVNVTIADVADIGNVNIGVWLKSQGNTDRTGIITGSEAAGVVTLIDLEPNTDYYITADAVGAYRFESEFNTGDYGTYPGSITLEKIVNADGSNVLPTSLTTQQRRIADMMQYNFSSNTTDIKLPSDYGADSRWDSTHNIWTFTQDDFFAIAYRVDELQSSIAFLASPDTILIEKYILTLTINSSFVIRQHSDNVDCVININAFTFKRDGDTIQAKTYVNHSQGTIETNAGNPIIATLSTPSHVLTAVTDTIPTKVNEATSIQKLDGLLVDAADGNGFAFSSKAVENVSGGGSGGGGLTSAQATTLNSIHTHTQAIQAQTDLFTFTADSAVISQLNTEQTSILTSIQTATTTSFESNLHTSLDSYSNKDAWKASATNMTQTDFNALMNGTTSEIKDLYKADTSSLAQISTNTDTIKAKIDNIMFTVDNKIVASVPGTVTLNTEQTSMLTAIQTATTTSFEGNLHTSLDSYSNKDDWKASTTNITQSDFDDLMNGTTQAIKDAYKATIPTQLTTSQIVDAILDTPYGTKSDGLTPLESGTLGAHWYLFYPPEIIRQFLEYTLDGTTQATRYQPSAGSYGSGTLGDALREILNRTTRADIPAGFTLDDRFKLDAIKSKTDSINIDINGFVESIAKTVEDKTGYTLTEINKDDIAVAVEQALLNEDDSRALIEAIVNKIGNENVSILAIAEAVWSDSRSGGVYNEDELVKRLRGLFGSSVVKSQ